MGGVN